MAKADAWGGDSDCVVVTREPLVLNEMVRLGKSLAELDNTVKLLKNRLDYVSQRQGDQKASNAMPVAPSHGVPLVDCLVGQRSTVERINLTLSEALSVLEV